MNNSIISKVIAFVIRCRYDGIVDIVKSIVWLRDEKKTKTGQYSDINYMIL
jgi:hypothetical protein